MTVPGVFRSTILAVLGHLVYGQTETGDLSGSVVLVVYTLCAGLIDGAGGCKKSFLCCCLVSCFDRCMNLLNSGLYSGTDSLVSLGSGLADKYPFLCRFDVCQVPVPPESLYITKILPYLPEPDTDSLYRHKRNCMIRNAYCQVKNYFLLDKYSQVLYYVAGKIPRLRPLRGLRSE